MKINEVVEYFGSKTKTAEALGIGKSTVSQWGEAIPELYQCKIQIITEGKLKADLPKEKTKAA